MSYVIEIEIKIETSRYMYIESNSVELRRGETRRYWGLLSAISLDTRGFEVAY